MIMRKIPVQGGEKSDEASNLPEENAAAKPLAAVVQKPIEEAESVAVGKRVETPA